jgi:antitoxin ParD1/3/4
MTESTINKFFPMNISLTPKLEKYIQEKVKSGLYTSVSEVIRESLRLMHTYDDLQKQRIEQLNQSIETGLLQLQAGKKVAAEEAYQRLKKKINK